jgi:hypothetical protein
MDSVDDKLWRLHEPMRLTSLRLAVLRGHEHMPRCRGQRTHTGVDAT